MKFEMPKDVEEMMDVFFDLENESQQIIYAGGVKNLNPEIYTQFINAFSMHLDELMDEHELGSVVELGQLFFKLPDTYRD